MISPRRAISAGFFVGYSDLCASYETRGAVGKTVTLCALRPVEIRVTRRRLFDFLIPVLVTGIQPDQVLGLERLSRAADAALLDSCDEHRNEGGEGAVPRRAS